MWGSIVNLSVLPGHQAARRIRSISVLHTLSYQPEAFVQERKRGVAPLGVHVMRGNPGREEALACLGGLLASAWEISDGGHDLSAARAKVVGRAV